MTSTLQSRFALGAFAVLWTGGGAHAAEPQLPDLGTEAPAKVERPARNYLLPAAEIAGFDFLLNRYNRWLRHDGQGCVAEDAGSVPDFGV